MGQRLVDNEGDVAMVELLAPVGNKEALIAAVEAGADAVYLAGKSFGARAYASNFADEELADAVRFSHLRNVLVYVTVNTLVDDSELPELVRYLRYLYEISVDAIIVQDVGVAKVAKEVVPSLPIHASTQMTIHNLEGVKLLTELGFKRIVLAREVSLSDIQTICEKTDTEIETFVHGALCISYSGQCLMSSMIGGRSGNRGRCAQPCRLPYTLIDDNNNEVLAGSDVGEYLLSPKDLNTLGLIPEFIQAGVKSFKIEGRMKRPEYVAVVVDTYRRAIDSYLASPGNYEIDQQDIKDLAQIFNRDFTTAYLKGKQGHLMMSDRRPNNRGVRIGRVLQYDSRKKTVTIKLDEPLSQNDILDFWVKVGGRVSATVSKIIVDGQETTYAPARKEVVLPLSSPVKANDRVFKVFDAKLMDRARGFFEHNEKTRIAINAEVKVSAGRPMIISLTDADGYNSKVSTEFIAEPALKRPLTVDTITKQIDRLGNTMFKLANLTCEIEDPVMVPLSEINDARRRAIKELEEARLAKFRRPLLENDDLNIGFYSQVNTSKVKKPAKPYLTVNVDTVEKAISCLENGADIIMFGGDSYNHKATTDDDYKRVVALAREKEKEVILSTPRIIKEWQKDAVRRNLELFKELEPDAVSVLNIGTLELTRDLNLKLHGDYSLNIYNSAAVEFCQGLGFNSITLSPELTLSQVERIVGRSELLTECLVHGFMELMVTEYCTMGSYLGGLHKGQCNQACQRGQYMLKDRKGIKFPLVTDQYCRMHVLNSKELSMIPHTPKFGEIGVNRIRIEGKQGTVEYIGKVTKLYRDILDQGQKHPVFTNSGLLERYENDITRGHYFRGVL